MDSTLECYNNGIFTDDMPNKHLDHLEDLILYGRREVTNAVNELMNHPKVKTHINITHGEGFGRPLLEASMTEKPIIASNWSGHLDFVKPEYNILIGGELKNVHPSAANEFLLKESKWFNINTDIAGRAMKDVFKHYKKYFFNSVTLQVSFPLV